MAGAGAISLGKTNTPEFGAGSHTVNPVFGATRNPWDPSRSAGGSSGGAAAALAARMICLADGSDLGGSLRNPASFCNVVGLRPSPGRVPSWPVDDVADVLGVAGPMARTVADVALLLSVLAGPDPRVPLALDAPVPVTGPGAAPRSAHPGSARCPGGLERRPRPAGRARPCGPCWPRPGRCSPIWAVRWSTRPPTCPARTTCSAPGGRSGSRRSSGRCCASIPGSSATTSGGTSSAGWS